MEIGQKTVNMVNYEIDYNYFAVALKIIVIRIEIITYFIFSNKFFGQKI